MPDNSFRDQRTLVFEVNETLSDLTPLRTRFEDVSPRGSHAQVVRRGAAGRVQSVCGSQHP